ncbi:hypothetical protein BgiBS90_020083 [Biomphalaria glabrata]|nr:hypothetical protein BgiBS90_020083 [Biomphalaria glabrata]
MTNVTSNNETICSTTTEKFSSHLELVVVLAVFAVLIDVATAYFNLTLIIALWRYTDPRCKNKITRIIVSSLSVSYVIVLLIEYLNSTVNPVLCLGIGFIRSALQAL